MLSGSSSLSPVGLGANSVDFEGFGGSASTARDSVRSSASWAGIGREEKWYSRPLPNSRGLDCHRSLSARARMRLSVLGNPGVLINSCAVYHSFMSALLSVGTAMAKSFLEAH